MICQDFDNYPLFLSNSEFPPLIDSYNSNEMINEMCNVNENIINIQENPKDEYNIYYLEKQTTKWKSLNINNLFTQEQQSKKKDISKYNCIPFDEIKENLIAFTKNDEIGKKLNKNKIIEDAEKKLCNIKRKRDDVKKNKEENNDISILIEEEKNAGEKKRRGRKIRTVKKTKIDHNKYSQDNIIKTIKSKLFSYSLKFLNNLLKSSNYIEQTYRLYKLAYKYIKKLKKEEDLKFLKMKLKDLYSLEVSPKYKSISKFHNKYLIKEILNNKGLQNYEALDFAFNLSFKEWIELFKYKKNIHEIIEYKKRPENISDEIEKNMIYVESLLKKIMEKNNNFFFSIFTFFLYNYEEWFEIKKERKFPNN